MNSILNIKYLGDGSYVKFNDLEIFYYNKKGKMHRDNDQPAFIRNNYCCTWYKNGILHRENNQPAAIFTDGQLEWWENNDFTKLEYNKEFANKCLSNFEEELELIYNM